MSTIEYSDGHRTTLAQSPVYSIPSILAIICAIAAFVVSAGWSLFLAIAAAILGVIGFAVAILPSKRGGIISILSIGLGALAFVIAILRIIF